jgi:hypothetical protein
MEISPVPSVTEITFGDDESVGTWTVTDPCWSRVMTRYAAWPGRYSVTSPLVQITWTRVGTRENDSAMSPNAARDRDIRRGQAQAVTSPDWPLTWTGPCTERRRRHRAG